MPSTKKAAVVTGLGSPIEIMDVDKPEARDGKVVVKIDGRVVMQI